MRRLHSAVSRSDRGGRRPAVVQSVLRAVFVLGRHLDKGNANPGNIGSDFNRLGVLFWTQVYTDDLENEDRRELLEDLNTWRNAIAHQDFDPSKLGGTTTLHLSRVRKWRKACNRLALSFDKIMYTQLVVVTGSAPW